MVSLLAQGQVGTIGLVVPPERLMSCRPIVDLFERARVDVATRFNLRPRSREELLRSLRRFRSRYEIIAVECTAPSVSRVAVRDRRVDIVYFPKQGSGNVIRGKLAKSCRAALEFNLAELLSGPNLETRLSRLRREMEVAAQASATVIGSSNASNTFQLRSPRDIAAILHVIGLPHDTALRAVSDVPLEIVKRNRLKMREPQLEEGVNIVRRSGHE